MIWVDESWSDLMARLEREAAAWSEPTRECRTCGGSGELHHLEHPPDPQSRVDYECPRCSGTGEVDA